jgi:anti-sigma B factor antagonist
MSYEIAKKDNTVELSLINSLYIEEVAKLNEDLVKLADDGYESFIIEASRLKYLDSSGIGVFIRFHKYLQAKNPDLTITFTNLNSQIKKLFDLSHLDKIFTIK